MTQETRQTATEPTPAEPVTAARMAEQLSRTVGDLTALMEGEVRLLQAMRTRELESLLPDKRSAAKSYRELLERLAEQPALLRDLDAPGKAAIKAAAERLAAATAANAHALRAGIEANGRLVKTIAAAVREARPGGDRYQANGSLTDGGSAGTPPALSVNQVL